MENFITLCSEKGSEALLLQEDSETSTMHSDDIDPGKVSGNKRGFGDFMIRLTTKLTALIPLH